MIGTAFEPVERVDSPGDRDVQGIDIELENLKRPVGLIPIPGITELHVQVLRFEIGSDFIEFPAV